MTDQTSRGSARPDSSLAPPSGKGLPDAQAVPGQAAPGQAAPAQAAPGQAAPLAVAPPGLPTYTNVYAAEAAPVLYASGRDWPTKDSFYSAPAAQGGSRPPLPVPPPCPAPAPLPVPVPAPVPAPAGQLHGGAGQEPSRLLQRPQFQVQRVGEDNVFDHSPIGHSHMMDTRMWRVFVKDSVDPDKPMRHKPTLLYAICHTTTGFGIRDFIDHLKIFGSAASRQWRGMGSSARMAGGSARRGLGTWSPGTGPGT